MATTLTVPERVARGVAWLDATVPDWPERVTLPEFDIRSTCSCVLGQVFEPPQHTPFGPEGFDLALRVAEAQGVDTAAESERWAGQCGFDSVRITPESDNSGADYDRLQDEWERVIRERQGS